MVRSMRRWHRERWFTSATLALCGITNGSGALAQLVPITAGQATVDQPQALRLEVFVNGHTTNLIEPFVLTPPDRLSATRSDLNDIGIKVPGSGSPRQRIDLNALPQVSYRFDAAGQRMEFHLADSERVARVYDANTRIEKNPSARSDWGALMNYSVYGTTTSPLGSFPRFAGVNATLNGRIFSPYGTLEQTEIVGSTVAGDRQQLRLDTTYTFSNPDWTTTARAGDTISGSLPWTRPVRYAGVQLQRDFGLRSDIVTLPLPTISGTAAVPSTVDVFVNSVKAYTQDVGSGPYSLTNLPILANSGNASVVVTDATGRQSVSTLPLFAPAALLAPGLTDYSVDAGFAREWYGTFSDDYNPRPIASATVRHGNSDWLTLEGHAEGGAGLINAGAGVVARLWSWGTVSAAASGSDYQRSVGGQIYGAYDIQIGAISFSASSQRAFGHFNDLASVSGSRSSDLRLGSVATGFLALDSRPPRALDQVSVAFPLWRDPTTLSISLINGVQADGERTRIIAASISRSLPYDASAFATAFVNLGDKSGGGLFAGLSFPLGERTRVSIGRGDGTNDVEIVHPLRREDGSTGWSLRGGSGPAAFQSADVAYRSGIGTAEIAATEQKGSLGTQGEFDGSVGFIGTTPFVANRIDDGFALVEAGAPHVPVLQDNRTIGETDPWGHFLVTDMGAYQRNQVGIDPNQLPNSAEAPSTRQVVVPASKSGVVIDFGVETHVESALVTFRGAGGKALPVGSRGLVEGQAEPFVVGYDGQAYLKHLTASNAVTIDTGDLECHAAFAYHSAAKRPTIGPVECR